MPYYAYPRNGAEISHAEYDRERGIRGRLTKKPKPIGAGESLADATEIAFAHLGRNPSDLVYVADAADLVHDVVINEGYHADQAASEKWLCGSIVLLILSATTLIASTFFSAGIGGFLSFLGVSCLYFIITRTGIQNEVEGGVVCFIILLLILMLLPAVAAARDAYKRKQGSARMEHQLVVNVRRITTRSTRSTQTRVSCNQCQLFVPGYRGRYPT